MLGEAGAPGEDDVLSPAEMKEWLRSRALPERPPSDAARQRNEWVERLRTRTRRIVQRHRAAVEALAAALLNHGTLTAKQVDDIVRRDW
jgi:ATP-dependent Zn protease